MAIITLDGSRDEGGGQMLRTALALSALTGIAFEMRDIRKNRPVPGLKTQHLHCIKAVQALCDASVEGAQMGSGLVRFMPRPLRAKSLSLDIEMETAGSIALVLQSVLLPALFCARPIRLHMSGGTDVAWSPSIDYCAQVLFPSLSSLGTLEAKLVSRGYYPKGGGVVDVKIAGKYSWDDLQRDRGRQSGMKLPIIELDEQFEFAKVGGVSHASLDLAPSQVAERQADAAKTHLGSLPHLIEITTYYSKSPSQGSGITLWAAGVTKETNERESRKFVLGADRLGEKGVKAEDVGREAAERLLKEMRSHACVDSHLADMMIPFLGVLGGRMRVSAITPHVRSNIYITEQFLASARASSGARFEIDERDKVISCAGARG